MFIIRTATSDKFEVNTPIDKVREFFTDIRNFVEIMPNVESIHSNPDGTARWTIRAKIPLIGAMRQSFSVELAENTGERVEWIPKTGETQNLLRYAADFIEKSAGATVVQFSQNVELRRNSAGELHFLAGLAGENRVSKGMQVEVAGMIKKFVRRAKEKLENVNN
ncbi:MAG TPA: SRPBCC domain-containing protein [Pyrinomonadaceae bacterium]|nr:SRPBCC domain-containing protein [Pyrinomonadaceae bacterium]